jgi:hypothetical protein
MVERHVLATVRINEPTPANPDAHVHRGGLWTTPWTDQQQPPAQAIWLPYGLYRISYSAAHNSWQLLAEEEILSTGWVVVAKVAGPPDLERTNGSTPPLARGRSYLVQHELNETGQTCQMTLAALAL